MSVVDKLGPKWGRASLVLQKHTPTILVAGGTLGMICSLGMAIQATRKLEPILEHHKWLVENVKDSYPEETQGKELSRVYFQTAGELFKLYGPTIAVAGGSTGAILVGHGILRNRNLALAAAYGALDEAFSQYRSRVVEEYGEEKDKDFSQGVRRTKVEGEDGKKHIQKTWDPNTPSPYAKWFDEESTEWSKTPEYNLVKVRSVQNFSNDLLRARGHVFLNEVYDALGLPHTQAGSVVGWVLSDDGDNFIDFGLYNPDSQGARDFINGFEKRILLDFNVDGVIFDKIGKKS